MKRIFPGASLTLVCLLALGCQSKLYDENQQLWQQNRELMAKNSDLEEKVRSSADPAQLAQMQAEISKRDAEIAQLQASLRQPEPGTPKEGLEGVEARYDARAGTLTVTIPGKILFDSGQADLKTTSKSTLNKVAAAIQKSYPSKRVYVDGHTDTDPIRVTKGKWEDNLELSSARAMSVARYLMSKGVAHRQVVVRAYGENNPKASKEASRRVEIVVALR